MRYGFIAALAAFAVCLAPAVKADEAKNDVKGLFLLTDYPAVTLRPGTTSTVNLRCRITTCRPSGWRCRSPACRRAGP